MVAVASTLSIHLKYAFLPPSRKFFSTNKTKPSANRIYKPKASIPNTAPVSTYQFWSPGLPLKKSLSPNELQCVNAHIYTSRCISIDRVANQSTFVRISSTIRSRLKFVVACTCQQPCRELEPIQGYVCKILDSKAPRYMPWSRRTGGFCQDERQF
jgi:hypothetical protein